MNAQDWVMLAVIVILMTMVMLQANSNGTLRRQFEIQSGMLDNYRRRDARKEEQAEVNKKTIARPSPLRPIDRVAHDIYIDSPVFLELAAEMNLFHKERGEK